MDTKGTRNRKVFNLILPVLVFIFFEQIYTLVLNASLPFDLILIFYIIEVSFFFSLLLNIIPRISSRNYIPKLFTSLILILAFATLICLTGLTYISVKTGRNSFSNLSKQNVILSLWRSSYIFTLAYVYYLVRENIRRLRREHLLIFEKANADRTKNELEIALLKSQINPHLLFNGFNFIYQRLVSKDPETARTVLLLSEMADYSLSDKRQTDLVTLDEDIENIRRYIQFQQELNNHQLHINLTDELQDPIKSVVLPPLLFLNFVENVFKHGVLDNKTEPATIKFYRQGNNLIFTTTNSIPENPNRKSRGTGLSNTRQRLQHYFPNTHKLEIQITNNTYHLFLSIKLWNSAATW